VTLRRGSLPPPQNWSPPLITEVREGSPCTGRVKVGDLLLELDGRPPLDILDYLEAGEGKSVSLRLMRDGRKITRRVRKEAGIPLGLVFDEAVFDGVRTCRNSCIFCFVDQMPAGLRETLYVKDDDYRLSFYYGNFITLNNLSRSDLERIRRLRLSPLYVSLHSTDPALRAKLMGGEAGRGLVVLRYLLDEGIEIHLQVVLCQGINDGEELRRTFQDVLTVYPAASLGVVPVGLTSHTAALPQVLPAHDGASARRVLETVDEYQELAVERYGRRLFFAADEFYLLAEREFPGEDAYEGYPQLENGVGMARKFTAQALAEFDAITPSGRPLRGVVTGAAGEKVLRRVIDKAGLSEVEVVAARNRLLGGTVTVTALLGGADIAAALREQRPVSHELLIPDSMLRDGAFIDDLTTGDVERETGCRLVPVEVDGACFVRALYKREERD
jgi:putative radical SAM enzyme (TIGR03279 family)